MSPEEAKIGMEMNKLSVEYRGKIIHLSVTIETYMDMFIAKFLSNNNDSAKAYLTLLLAYKDGLLTFSSKQLIKVCF